MRSSGGNDSSHWLVQLRNSIAKVVATMFELAVWNTLSNDPTPEKKLQPHQLYSAKSGHKIKMGTLDKMQLIQKLADSHGGSHETMCSVLSEHRGLSQVMVHTSNRLYEEGAAASFLHCHTLSVSWDGATYAGHSVNIAMAMCCQSLNAAYLRPVVDTPPL